MIDFTQARRAMVDSQIRVNDVTDAALIAAMLEVPREKFVPDSRAALAYIDEDLCVLEPQGGNTARYVMEPMVLARLLQALELDPSCVVLDVGCATGYSAAVLSRLVQRVIALEENETLAEIARKQLAGSSNVDVVTEKASAGWPAGQPYDAILIGGAVQVVPAALTAQLREGGRLAAVIRTDAAAKATLLVKTGGHISARRLFDAAIPPLPGFEAPETFVF